MKRFLFNFTFILAGFCLKAQQVSTDTVLNMVLSEPFFYNVLADIKGNIYAGTSNGIIKLNGKEQVFIKDESGYITLDKEGNPIIAPEGISNYHEKKYLYLLPYPDQVRNEFHSGTESQFYICSGGRLYIYDILPYSYSYDNHSIRSISPHFVGTYSGLYRDGVLVPDAPDFCDGYIREINGKTFVCYDYIWMTDLSKSSDVGKSVPNLTETKGGIYDIAFSKQTNSYYITSRNTLYSLDSSLSIQQPIYESKSGPISLIDDVELSAQILLLDKKFFVSINLDKNDIDTLAELEEPLLAGTHVEIFPIHLLSNSTLYVYNGDGTVTKLIGGLKKAHSLVAVSSSELVIATDMGLFLFNTVSKVISPLIEGIEFNRRALYLGEGKIYAGSINGLYTIDVNKLHELAAELERRHSKKFKISSGYLVGISIISIIAVVVLLIFLLKSRKEVNESKVLIKEMTLETINRERIENFIKENLATASINSITDHFKTNKSFIYRLLEPDKPGTIIQKFRQEMVIKMKSEGHSIKEISIATGLSQPYINRMKWSNETQ